MNIENEIQNLFIKNHWSLSLAESCTGGAIAAALCKIPGCSSYFLGSLVCYSEKIKNQVLDVPMPMIDEYSAVSEQVAKAMALGVLQRMHSDFSLAITGIAGPSGGTATNPVGTIWISVLKEGETPMAFCFHEAGSREEIIEKSVDRALNVIYSYVQKFNNS